MRTLFFELWPTETETQFEDYYDHIVFVYPIGESCVAFTKDNNNCVWVDYNGKESFLPIKSAQDILKVFAALGYKMLLTDTDNEKLGMFWKRVGLQQVRQNIYAIKLHG